MKQLNTKRFWILLIALTSFSMLISACGPAEPTVDINVQRTGFAQTADAQATATAEALPTSTPTEIPTATATPTPEATPTPSDSETETEDEGETPTETNNEEAPSTGGTDGAVLIAQEPSDNTTIKPGDPFTATWTLENTGTSTWTISYYIEFASGEQMNAADRVFVWLPVPPGTSLPISVNFTAPESEGTYRSNWKLSNANDVAFYDFSIVIEVSNTAESAPDTPTNTPEPTATEEP